MNYTTNAQNYWRLAFAGLLCLLLGLGTGCGPLEPMDGYSAAQPAIKGDKAGTDIPGASNILRVGELVKIDFSGPPVPPQKHEENIKDDGTITLYLLGPVKAAGKTPGQLQTEIHDLYVPRYFRHLNVTLKAADRFFIVGGEVKRPDRQLYLGPITVTGAIKAAGDFTDFANKRSVKLTRADGTIYTINTVKALTNPSLDLPVYPGDTVHVPGRVF